MICTNTEDNYLISRIKKIILLINKMSQTNSSRVHSGSRGWCTHNKFRFQEKIKQRGATTSAIGSHDGN